MKTITAKFKGKDGSLGFKKGEVYTISIDQKVKGDISIKTTNLKKAEKAKVCKYNTIVSFLSNWEIVEKVSEPVKAPKVDTRTIFEKVKTFEDAYKLLAKSDKDKKDYDKIKNIDVADYIKDSLKRVIIAKALNEGWKPNWSNTSEYKWFPYFSFASGFSFSDSHYYNFYTHSTVGFRLCFKSEKLSDYFGKQFIDLHESVLTLKENK